MLPEKKIEEFFRKQALSMRCMVLKFVSPGYAGVPDRIVIAEGVPVFFIEFKAPGKEPRKLQHVVIDKIKTRGHKVYIVDTKEKAKQILDGIHTKNLPDILH